MNDNHPSIFGAAYMLAHGRKSRDFGSLCAAFTRPRNRRRLPSAFEHEDVIKPRFTVNTMSYRANGRQKQAEVFEFGYPRPKAVIASVSGWKGHPIAPDEAAYLAALRGAGFAVMAIALEDPGNKTEPLEGSIARVEKFLYSKDSPLHEKYGHLPCAIIPHSAACKVLQRATDRAETIPKNTIGIPTAPFLNPSNASHHHPLKQWAYQYLHAIWHKNAFAGDTFFDELHYYLQGIGPRLQWLENRPTHGQILQLSSEGAQLIQETRKRIEDGETLAVNRLKQIFVISADDSFACPLTAIEYAKLIGAEIMMVRADHNPLMNAAVREQIIARIDQEFADLYPASAIVPNYATEPETVAVKPQQRPRIILEETGLDGLFDQQQPA